MALTNDELEVRLVAQARNRGHRRRGEPRVIGAKDAADLLGVRQSNLRTLAGLPEPYDVIAATTLWRELDIKEFARARARRLG